MVLILVVVCGTSIYNYQNELKRIAYIDQEVRIRVFWSLLKQKGEVFSLVDNKLMVGSYVLNDNFELPDKVKEICGGTATVFMKDVRVSTNVMKADGARAVGTKLKGKAYDAIFKEQRSYRGETEILGTPYFTAYDPIRNAQGEVIGVLYTGVKKSDFFAANDRIKATVIIIAVLFTALMCLFMHFLISIMVTRPIETLVDGIKDIAEGEGDLTKRIVVSSNDEIGVLAEWFNTFITSMEQIIGRIKSIADDMDHATNEVASGSQGLAKATQETAAAVEQVASTIEEITASIKNNAQNADKGSHMAKSMVDMTDVSSEASRELMKAMGEISTASKKVGDIISTVNEVAFQTNLLALNAAVEAARAGEHGKGFAVVAEEVRALAQRSAEAANQIRNLIQDTMQKVHAGDKIDNRSVESLTEIITQINELSGTMDEVAASSNEQSSGVDEVNRALTRIDSTTQQNATNVEVLASTSDNLSIEARELAFIVEHFKVSAEAAGRSTISAKPGKAGAERTAPSAGRSNAAKRKPGPEDNEKDLYGFAEFC